MKLGQTPTRMENALGRRVHLRAPTLRGYVLVPESAITLPRRVNVRLALGNQLFPSQARQERARRSARSKSRLSAVLQNMHAVTMNSGSAGL
jgi:hypothetical protein